MSNYNFILSEISIRVNSNFSVQDLGPMPWKAILTSVPVWALIIGEIGHDWGLYTMVTDLPKYMSDVIKFNPAEVIESKPSFTII